MSRARKLDPITRDFSTTASRQYQQASSPLENKLVMAYSVALGAWEGDPGIGHRFGELAREKDTVETRSRLGDLAVEAAAWLIAAGDLDRVEVTVESFAPGKLAFEVVAFPPAQQPPVTVGPFFVPVSL